MVAIDLVPEYLAAGLAFECINRAVLVPFNALQVSLKIGYSQFQQPFSALR
jgi:hypothetical protein